MDQREVLKILGMSELIDENSIKTAYREKLVSVNPEDDPQGFMQLRLAFERALELLEEPQEEESEFTKWIHEVEGVYKSLKDRVDVKKWQELFQKGPITELDTENDAILHLLSFLSYHYYIPQDICAYICKKINLKDSMLYFSEYIPLGFLEYLQGLSEEGSFIDFSLFEGDLEVDCDEYIKDLYDVVAQVNGYEEWELDTIFSWYLPKEILQTPAVTETRSEEEKIAQQQLIIDKIEKLEHSDLKHPFLTIQNIRIQLFLNNVETVRQLLGSLTDGQRENHYIQAYEGFIFLYLKEFKSARKCCQILQDKDPESELTIRLNSDLLMVEKDYDKARDGYYEILEKSRINSRVLACVKICNRELAKIWEHSVLVTDRIEYAWCLLDLEQNHKCLEVLESVKPESLDDYYLYYCTKSRVLRELEKRVETIDNAKKWIQAIEQLPIEDTKKSKRRKKRTIYANCLIAESYFELAKANKDKPDLLSFYYKQAMDATTDFDKEENELNRAAFQYLKAQILEDMGDYNQAIELANKILADIPNYIPAVALRQKCYYGLNNLKGVMDDYERLKEEAKEYMESYVLAAKSLYYSGYKTDAEEIIAFSKTIKSSFFEIQALELEMYLDDCSGDQSVLGKLSIKYHALRDEYNKCDKNEKQQSAFYYIAYRIEHKMDHLKEAMEMLDRLLNIELNEDYVLQKADIILELKGYKEAIYYLRNFKPLAKSSGLQLKIAEIYKNSKRNDDAILAYEKAIELDKNCYEAYYYLIRIYHNAFLQKETPNLYQLAIKYANLYVAQIESVHSLSNRGLVQLESEHWIEAKADLMKALELDPKHCASLDWLGETYRFLRQYDQANECYDKAMELMSIEEYRDPFVDKATCLLMEKKYAQSRELWTMLKKAYPERFEYQENILLTYELEKNYVEWERELILTKTEYPNNLFTVLEKLSTMYETTGRMGLAEKTCKEIVSKYPNNAFALVHYGEFLLRTDDLLHLKSKAFLKKIPHSQFYNNNFTDWYLSLLMICIKMSKKWNNRTEIERYRKQYLDYIVAKHGSISNYQLSFGYRNIPLYKLGDFYHTIGDYAEAAKYFALMDKGYTCKNCKYGICVEWYLGRAKLNEASNRLEEAIADYEVAIEYEFDYLEYQAKIDELKKKVGNQR